MLVALDTVFLRISPAPQRKLQEDTAGVHKDRWLTYVLDLPVVAAPLPSLHEHHSEPLPDPFVLVCKIVKI